uniref:Opioid related nociceptin receptor 1 n=1 Tax=Sinocyclocheilus anshuiensis TaxID=1608454 RepID=A0A671RX45_9TELE
MELLELSDVLQMFNDSRFQGNLSDLDDVHEPLPKSAKITVVVVYLIVCVVGLVGNCLVMYVHKDENIYIFNLALADALVLATPPFQGTDVTLGFWPFVLALCKAVVASDYYNMFTSVFTLTVMSVDPKLINVAVWVLASAIGLPVMIMGQVEKEKDVYGSAKCILNLPKPREHWWPVFVICVFLFSFLIPVVIISICYGLMVRCLRSVRLLSSSREKDWNLRRITYMVLSVVAAFVLCWMPVHVLVLIQVLGHVDLGASQSSMAAMHFFIALGYANSCFFSRRAAQEVTEAGERMC